jgi:hypothetical protein
MSIAAVCLLRERPFLEGKGILLLFYSYQQLKTLVCAMANRKWRELQPFLGA